MKQISLAKIKKTETFSSEGTASLCSGDTPALVFQEWSDHDVNAEKWEAERDKESSEEKYFCDPQGVQLPPSFVIKQWKRPHDVYQDADIILYKDSVTYPDLNVGSTHLLHSNFIRQFISSMETLYYLGDTQRFQVEHTSSLFYPTMEPPWRPWHHIYSKCKTGKTGQHTPSVNKFGKYIVRLFWMGCWRKIYVDDCLPLSNDNVLLPCIEISMRPSNDRIIDTKSKKQRRNVEKKSFHEINNLTVELWPFLLSKALLKVACLTWNLEDDIVDFDIIQCLTGWVPIQICRKNFTSFEFWNECVINTKQYTYPSEQDAKGSGVLDHKQHTSTKEFVVQNGKVNNYVKARFIKADLDRYWSHDFLIVQTRDIPIYKPTEPGDYPSWKQVRWLNWAARKGLIPSVKSDEPIQSLLVVDPFRNLYQPLTIDRTEAAFDDKGDGYKVCQSKVGTDYAFWVDYKILSEHLKCLIVYFRPSCFLYTTSISSFQSGQGELLSFYYIRSICVFRV